MTDSNEFLKRILGRVPHAPEGKPNSEYDILAMIAGYEDQGHEILRAAGYSPNFQKLMRSRFSEDGTPLGKEPLPLKIRDAIEMLSHFHAVRFHLKRNDISWALCYMAYGVQAAMKAKVRPVEPFIESGEKHIQAQRLKREKRQLWRGKTRAEIRARNMTIKEHYARSGLKPNSFAEKHAKKYALKPRQIRYILNSDIGT
jgi:hypothetical protein